MAHCKPWRAGPAGVYTAESNEFRLTVRAAADIGGGMRFLVVRRGRERVHDTLIGSGTTDTSHAAMVAAERMAERCARTESLSQPEH
jgi:hypothetical protein